MSTSNLFENSKDVASSFIKSNSVELFPQSDDLERKREAFLDEIEKNPSMLDELPLEKLEILDKYYDQSIKKLENKIKNKK